MENLSKVDLTWAIVGFDFDLNEMKRQKELLSIYSGCIRVLLKHI
jgi:hypothetical protein